MKNNVHISNERLELLAEKHAMQLDAATEFENQHLNKCNLCNEKFVFLAAFYKKLNEEFEKPIEPNIVEKINSLANTNIITFEKIETDIELTDANNHLLFLAADSIEKSTEKCLNIGNYFSHNDNVLIRLIYDKFLNSIYAYVVAAHLKYNSPQIVMLNTEEGPQFFSSTTADGVAKFDDLGILDTSIAGISLLSSAASVSLENGKEDYTFSPHDVVSLKVVNKELSDNFVIQIKSNRNFSFAILLLDNGKSKILKVADSKIDVDVDIFIKITGINFY